MRSRRPSRGRPRSPRRSPGPQPSRRPRPRRTPSRLQSRSLRPRPSRRSRPSRAGPSPPAPPSRRTSAWTNGPEERASAAASTTVTIKDFEFTPAKITVSVGDTVTWKNDGPTAHSATADDGSFDTGVYGKGQSRSHTFDAAGTFAYICTPHPFMKGTVTVEAASTGGGGGTRTAGRRTPAAARAATPAAARARAARTPAPAARCRPPAATRRGCWPSGCLLLALGIAVRRRANAG